jgi:hypothetical protein
MPGLRAARRGDEPRCSRRYRVAGFPRGEGNRCCRPWLPSARRKSKFPARTHQRRRSDHGPKSISMPWLWPGGWIAAARRRLRCAGREPGFPEVRAAGGVLCRYVFAAPDGEPLEYSNFRYLRWLPACEAAGVRGLQFHDLRRANATGLVAEGVDVKTAQSRLGHSDPRLTLAVYAQKTTEGDRQAADLLASRFMQDSDASRESRAMDARWNGPERETGPVETGPDLRSYQSGRRDLNPRPQRPERCALPSCATSRGDRV